MQLMHLGLTAAVRVPSQGPLAQGLQAIASQGAALSCLQTLDFNLPECGDGEMSAATDVLTWCTALTALQFHAQGYELGAADLKVTSHCAGADGVFYGHPEISEHALGATEPGILAEFARTIRGLPSLTGMMLQLDCWYPGVSKDLFSAAHSTCLTVLHFHLPSTPTWYSAPNRIRLPCDLLTGALSCVTRLQKLHLSGCRLSEESMHALHASLSLPSLTALKLEGAVMTTAAAKAFASALSFMTLPFLGLLDLEILRDPEDGEGSFGRDGACKVLEVIEKLPELPSLQVLILKNRGQLAMDDYYRQRPGGMHMQESVAGSKRFGRAIASVLSGVARLRKLVLQGMDVNHESLKLVAPSLTPQEGLIHLDLGATCTIDASAAQALLTHLSGHPALAEVCIEEYTVQQSLMEVLAQWFRSLPALQTATFEMGVRLTPGARMVLDNVAKELGHRCRIFHNSDIGS